MKPSRSMTPDVAGSWRLLSCCLSMSIPFGASFTWTCTICLFVSWRISSVVPCDVYQCQLSRRRPMLSVPIASVSSSISYCVDANGKRNLALEVLGPTNSRPNLMFWSWRILAAWRRRVLCWLKFWRYVRLLSPGRIHVAMRVTPSLLRMAAWRGSCSRPCSKRWASLRKSMGRPAVPYLMPLFFICASQSVICELDAFWNSFGLGAMLSNPYLAA